ncbi:MAG: amidohydrolase family protein, partial [Desulfobulbaceae bacterium]
GEGGADIRLAATPSADGEAAASLAPTGGDYLRILYTAGIGDAAAPSPRLGPDDLRFLLRQRGGRKAVVVANGRQAVAEALAVGCDAIEQGYGMGGENVRTMAAQGVLWLPGLLLAKNALDGAGSGGDVCCRFSQRYVAPGKPVPGAEAFWKKTLADQLDLLRQAGEAGVKTAIGTGAGNPGILHGESVVEEMKLFVKAGWSLAATIRCASAEGAEFFGMDGLGRLEVGRRATFLVVRGTVQQLPRKLAFLEAVYIDGAPSLAYRKDPVRATA